tara:strand:+ start:2137 stop:3351 length:1215 start_codon:yes stop_codon:yes gene_type:complete
MAIKGKEIYLNNYFSVDIRPDQRDAEISEFEQELIKSYLENILPDIEQAESTIELVNSNFFYESYSFLSDNKKYLLKISLDPDNKKLSTEKKALDSVSDLISPEVINYTNDEDSKIEFMLCSWENGENFDFFGIDELLHNLGTLVCNLDFVHESDSSDMMSFEDKLIENESILETIEAVGEKEKSIFEKLIDLDIDNLKHIFSRLKRVFEEKYSEDITVLCHSNLKKSNILYQSEYIKFINFENSHKADIYYSLLKVVNNLNLFKSAKKVSSFLTKYHSNSRLVNHLSYEEFLKNYEEKKETNQLLLFQDILHKVLFHFNAYGAFYKLENLTSCTDLYNNLRPTVQKYFSDHVEGLDKLFYTCITSVKTYDIDELNKIAGAIEEDEEDTDEYSNQGIEEYQAED